MIRNNIIIARIGQFKGWPFSGSVFENNIYYVPRGNTTEIYGKFFKELIEEDVKDVKLDKNLYYAEGQKLVPGDEMLKLLRDNGYDTESVYDLDPLFEDWENGNYDLKPASPALKIGFKQIPFEKMGLKDDFPKRYL